MYDFHYRSEIAAVSCNKKPAEASMASIPGYIIWLRSNKTGKEFPSIVFSADVDFVTRGLVCLTSIENHDLIVTRATVDEEEQLLGRGSDLIEERINNELGRSDLRFVHLLRWKRRWHPLQWIRNWRNVDYLYYYTDPYSTEGEATQTRQSTIKQFVDAGGNVLYKHDDNRLEKIESSSP